jgi:hypothetical protein
MLRLAAAQEEQQQQPLLVAAPLGVLVKFMQQQHSRIAEAVVGMLLLVRWYSVMLTLPGFRQGSRSA